MKFYIDSADINEIKEGIAMGLCDGVTTNPTLIAKACKPGQGFKEMYVEICKAVAPGPVSAEVISLDAEGIYREGCDLAKLADNIVVKVPMCIEGLKAVKKFAA